MGENVSNLKFTGGLYDREAAMETLEFYLGYPVFMLQGVINFASLLMASLLVAFITTFYLKKKDESTRVAGVILEKRIEAQHDIQNFIENATQKLEMIQPEASATRELLLNYSFKLPYDPHIQYPSLFTSITKYRDFFHDFEKLFTKHRLWLDPKTRHQMFLMQGYFSSINALMLLFNRLPLPDKVNLTKDEMEELSDQLIFLLGIVLDEEFNQLVMKLDVLLIRSIYSLNLARPKRSFMSQEFNNKEAKKASRFLTKKSVMGQSLPKLVVLSLELIEALKGIELSEKEHFSYFRQYSGKAK